MQTDSDSYYTGLGSCVFYYLNHQNVIDILIKLRMCPKVNIRHAFLVVFPSLASLLGETVKMHFY